MRLKGIYVNKSTGNKISLLLLLIFISVILHTLFATALITLFTDNGMILIEQQNLNDQTAINYLKLLQLFSSIGLFITPIIFYAYLTNFDFKFNKINRQSSLLTIAIIMLITPFIALLLEWNMMIPFPDWVMQFDIQSENIIVAFLQMRNTWDFLFTLLVIAIVPAIGEELLFRGYLQQNITSWIKDPHISIFITASVFSAIHLDFQGIIPRFVLGLLLGYLFYWSNSLWLPVLAHFINNTQAIILSSPLFKINDGAYSIFSNVKVDPVLALFSLCSVILLLYILYQDIKKLN